jgi:hypothetical protein
MASAATDTIGSLVIDLRANVAQLQADMDQVKDIVTKSSAQMSSQMRSDMQETRQTLALLRDDFGVGIPRELRAVVASSETARTAIMAMSNAFVGLAFINIAVEGFKKLSEYLDSASAKAAQEAKSTLDIAFAAQQAVDATIKRNEALELIGKGEDDRAAIQAAFYATEKQRNTERLVALRGQLQARLAILKTYENAPDATPDRAASAEAGIDDGGTPTGDSNGSTASLYAQAVKDAKPELEALQKAIDDATAGAKSSALQYSDYLKSLAEDSLKNDETIALAKVALRKKTADDELQSGKIGIDAYLAAEKGAAEAEYDIKLESLYNTLAILELDPSRNVKLIQDTFAKIDVLHIDHEKDKTDILAKGVEARKKIIDDENTANMKALGSMGLANKNETFPSNIIQSLAASSSAKPKLDGSIAGFMQGQSQNLLGNTMKDAAAQGKLLETAMEGLLTPTQKYEVLQAEIVPLMDRYKAYPDVVKALTVELQKANPEFQKMQEASSEFGKDLSTEIENIALSGKSLHDVLISLLQDLEKIVLEATLLKPLQDFFAGSGSSTGGGLPGFLSNLFGIGGSSGGGAAAAAGGVTVPGFEDGFLEGFADGGNPPVGVPSIVGENGPELFVPQSAGTIVPNGQYGGSTQIINIDARGSTPGSAPAIQRAVQTALQQNVRQSVAASIDYQRRR